MGQGVRLGPGSNVHQKGAARRAANVSAGLADHHTINRFIFATSTLYSLFTKRKAVDR